MINDAIRKPLLPSSSNEAIVEPEGSLRVQTLDCIGRLLIELHLIDGFEAIDRVHAAMVVTDDEIIRTHPVHKIFPGIQFVDQRIEIEVLEIFARRLFAANAADQARKRLDRSEEHTSELQSLMRISYAVFCLKKK